MNVYRATFAQVQPILGTRNVTQAVQFYVERLGFTLAFGDPSVEVAYVGLRRDNVELHLQFQYEHEMSTTRLRFVVDDPDLLYAEYRRRDAISQGTKVADTAWGTREFALYDPDRNALTFYRDLNRPE